MALVPRDPTPKRQRKAEQPAGPWPHRRIAVGLGLFAVLLLLQQVPLPGVDLSVLFQFVSDVSGYRPGSYVHLSLGAVGIMPYISACVLVELFHALLHWSRRKGMQPRDRRRLPKIALGVTMALAALQGWGIAVYVESMRMPTGALVVGSPGMAFRLTVMATLIATTLFLVWLSRLASRHGLGNGVALLLLFSMVSPLWRSWVPNLVGWYQKGLIQFGESVVAIAVAVGIFYGLFRFERWHIDVEVPRSDGSQPLRWQLKGNPAGLVPRDLASQVMWLPMTVAALFEAEEWFYSEWSPGGWPFQLMLIVLAATLAWPYVYLTARPARLVTMLQRAGLAFKGASESLQRAHRKRFALGLAYLLAVCVAAWAAEHVGFLWVFTQLVSVLTALYLLAIVLDLMDEFAFRRRSPHAQVVLVEHEIHAAKLVQAVLEQGNGIPCLIQAYHARALDTFFGPYLELAIWVPEDRAEQAQEILVEINAPLT